jgi:hypothetical protein
MHIGQRLLLLAGVVACIATPPAAFADPAGPPGCGIVTDPDIGRDGYVAVVQGNSTCQVAMAVIDRYLHDPTLEHNGNSWHAMFDGWSCNQPTAIARRSGYWTSCTTDTNDEIQIKFMPEDLSPQ